VILRGTAISRPATPTWAGLTKHEIIVQRAITPVAAPDASNFRNAEQRELHLSGLQLTMGEGQ
jgi:hypothetical protein